MKMEEEQEAAWDAQADDQAMPGGFGETPQKPTRSTRAEEEPVSMFDLSRRAVTAASSGLGGLLSNHTQSAAPSAKSSSTAPAAPAAPENRERKRDQLLGAFTRGIGYAIGAPVPPREQPEVQEERE